MKDIFLISGLGADRRVFDFLDLSAYSCHYISWIDPLQDESIERYSARLSEQIESPNPILIGVSFGGMIAVEIGKQIKTEKIILISSARTRSEIPWYTRLTGMLNLHKLASASWLKKPGQMLFYFFGVKHAEEKALLAQIVRDTNSDFLTWAIDKIARWKNISVPDNTLLIHGSDDRLFPFNKGDITIPQGGHFMIVNKGEEISNHVKQLLG